ncbi:hypothetical protein ACQ4PT_069953 [Festuca glaucescens]
MARAPAARRRVDKDAMAKSLLVVLGLALLAAACTGGQHGRGAATAASSDDDNLQQRQAAMKEAVKVFSEYNQEVTDPRALERAVATVNREVGMLRPIFQVVSRMPEGSAKEEARAAAKELLTHHLAQLLPGGSVKIADDMP